MTSGLPRLEPVSSNSFPCSMNMNPESEETFGTGDGFGVGSVIPFSVEPATGSDSNVVSSLCDTSKMSNMHQMQEATVCPGVSAKEASNGTVDVDASSVFSSSPSTCSSPVVIGCQEAVVTSVMSQSCGVQVLPENPENRSDNVDLVTSCMSDQEQVGEISSSVALPDSNNAHSMTTLNGQNSDNEEISDDNLPPIASTPLPIENQETASRSDDMDTIPSFSSSELQQDRGGEISSSEAFNEPDRVDDVDKDIDKISAMTPSNGSCLNLEDTIAVETDFEKTSCNTHEQGGPRKLRSADILDERVRNMVQPEQSETSRMESTHTFGNGLKQPSVADMDGPPLGCTAELTQNQLAETTSCGTAMELGGVNDIDMENIEISASDSFSESYLHEEKKGTNTFCSTQKPSGSQESISDVVLDERLGDMAQLEQLESSQMESTHILDTNGPPSCSSSELQQDQRADISSSGSINGDRWNFEISASLAINRDCSYPENQDTFGVGTGFDNMSCNIHDIQPNGPLETRLDVFDEKVGTMVQPEPVFGYALKRPAVAGNIPVKNFICNFCVQGFESEYLFFNHLQSHVFSCTKCQFCSLSQEELFWHSCHDHAKTSSYYDNYKPLYFSQIKMFQQVKPDGTSDKVIIPVGSNLTTNKSITGDLGSDLDITSVPNMVFPPSPATTPEITETTVCDVSCTADPVTNMGSIADSARAPDQCALDGFSEFDVTMPELEFTVSFSRIAWDQFKCELCSFTTYSPFQLLTHLNDHPNQVWSCGYCNTSTNEKEDLIVHQEVLHDTLAPSIQSHTVNNIYDVITDTEKDCVFYCYGCPFVNQSVHSILQHIAHKHREPTNKIMCKLYTRTPLLSLLQSPFHNDLLDLDSQKEQSKIVPVDEDNSSTQGEECGTMQDGWSNFAEGDSQKEQPEISPADEDNSSTQGEECGTMQDGWSNFAEGDSQKEQPEISPADEDNSSTQGEECGTMQDGRSNVTDRDDQKELPKITPANVDNPTLPCEEECYTMQDGWPHFSFEIIRDFSDYSLDVDERKNKASPAKKPRGRPPKYKSSDGETTKSEHEEPNKTRMRSGRTHYSFRGVKSVSYKELNGGESDNGEESDTSYKQQNGGGSDSEEFDTEDDGDFKKPVRRPRLEKYSGNPPTGIKNLSPNLQQLLKSRHKKVKEAYACRKKKRSLKENSFSEPRHELCNKVLSGCHGGQKLQICFLKELPEELDHDISPLFETIKDEDGDTVSTCNWCGREFIGKSASGRIREHCQGHCNMYFWSCMYCTYTNRRPSNIVKHTNLSHPKKKLVIVSRRPYVKPKRGLFIGSGGGANFFTLSKETTAKASGLSDVVVSSWECRICGRLDSRQNIMVSHVQTCHPKVRNVLKKVTCKQNTLFQLKTEAKRRIQEAKVTLTRLEEARID